MFSGRILGVSVSAVRDAADKVLSCDSAGRGSLLYLPPIPFARLPLDGPHLLFEAILKSVTPCGIRHHFTQAPGKLGSLCGPKTTSTTTKMITRWER